MLDGNGPLDTASIGEQVTERLRSEIISGRLAPGSRLMLDQYKALWNISITPLRDAAKRLEADGLVHIYPRRGIFVAEIDRNALMEVFQLRIALEPLVTELATPTPRRRRWRR
ncbi:GntR family transcriptional regulator [Azospirillum argentinense]|nr:GntR family transcriptional regulator [Azospirillum argentinense]